MEKRLEKEYFCKVLNIFVKKLIKQGKKEKSINLNLNLLKKFKFVEKEYNGLKVLGDSVYNVSPKLEIISKKVGGGRYQIPVPLNEKKQISEGVSNLLKITKLKSYGDLESKLLNELVKAYNKEGEAVLKKESLYDLASKNRANLKFLK